MIADRAHDEALRNIAVKQRKLSPRYPSINEVLARRRRWRETFIARLMLVLCALSIITTIFLPQHRGFAFLCAGVWLIGFIVTCFVAGAREQDWNGRG